VNRFLDVEAEVDEDEEEDEDEDEYGRGKFTDIACSLTRANTVLSQTSSLLRVRKGRRTTWHPELL
jgi:hypothetical protein